MGFKALTVNTAAEAAGHIYAEDDAAIFQSMFGGDGVLNIGNCLKSTVISNNKVRISDGVLSVGGHIGRLSHADYQDMTIENGATGYNRNDIIYARFLTSGNVDSFILAVKKGTATTGTASDPALVQGNLYEGAVERDYPLYRVKLSGLSIASVDQLFTVIPTIPDLKAQMAKDKAEINQSLTNVNDLKRTYLRLVLPNIAADAKTVCDYINKNYLLGQLSPATTVDFDVVASNADWFTGTLSTDVTVLSAGRTVWGIVQQRTVSAENSTLYKYFAAGEGGASSVSALDHVKSFIDVSTILKSYTTIAAGATVTYTATRDCFVNVSAYAHGSGQNTKIYINNVLVFNPYTNNGDNAGLVIVDKTVPLKTGQTIKIENGTYTTSAYAIFAAF